MKSLRLSHLPVRALAGLVLSLPALVQAGMEISPAPEKKIIAPMEEHEPLSITTFGGKFSQHLQSAYVDSMFCLWSPGDYALFLNTRSTIDDNQQYLSNYGLVGRYLVPNHDMIVGLNAYYDSIHSGAGNDFDQLGLGVELMTRWIDARFNYYLPDEEVYEIGGSSHRSTSESRSGSLGQFRTTTTRTRTSRRLEGTLQGFNAEVGFLVPGLDRYMDVRLFAGAYYYENPFGGPLSGFKGRLEARLLPGVIADVEYWDDTYLMGGHWVGELRVAVPFSIYNLVTGRNPFEGAGEMFRPGRHEFRERMSEMVIRSHRVQTSTNQQTNTSTSSTTETVPVQTPPPPPVVVAPPIRPPPDDEGGGGDDA